MHCTVVAGKGIKNFAASLLIKEGSYATPVLPSNVWREGKRGQKVEGGICGRATLSRALAYARNPPLSSFSEDIGAVGTSG